MIKYSFELDIDGRVVDARWLYSPDSSCYYCTSCGEGIFFVCPRKNSRDQLVGTCDFSIYHLTPSAARSKIRAWSRKRFYEEVL